MTPLLLGYRKPFGGTHPVVLLLPPEALVHPRRLRDETVNAWSRHSVLLKQDELLPCCDLFLADLSGKLSFNCYVQSDHPGLLTTFAFLPALFLRVANDAFCQ